MYEIWLGLNIIYEWILMNPTLPLLMAIALVAVFAMNRSNVKNWKGGFKPALKIAALVFAVLFFVLPMLVKSSVTELKYSMDWLNHLMITGGFAGFAGVLVWFFTASKTR